MRSVKSTQYRTHLFSIQKCSVFHSVEYIIIEHIMSQTYVWPMFLLLNVFPALEGTFKDFNYVDKNVNM